MDPQYILRAGPRLRPIRPLPRAPLLEKAPNLKAFLKKKKKFIYKYFRDILKHFSLHLFSLLRRLKELSNSRDRGDKTNLNK